MYGKQGRRDIRVQDSEAHHSRNGKQGRVRYVNSYTKAQQVAQSWLGQQAGKVYIEIQDEPRGDWRTAEEYP